MSRLRRWARALGVSAGVALVVVAAMALQSVRAPGAGSAEARFAEWGRTHGLGPEVSWLEHVDHSPAKRFEPSGRG